MTRTATRTAGGARPGAARPVGDGTVRPFAYAPGPHGLEILDPEVLAPRPARGRHRKPRPRRALLTAGGLALAAGAFSLVRLLPEPSGGGPGTAGADAPSTEDFTEIPAAPAATAGVSPGPDAPGPVGAPSPGASASPSATGPGADPDAAGPPVSTVILSPGAGGTPAEPDTTGIPTAPAVPEQTTGGTTPRAPGASGGPAPGTASATPAPHPERSGSPGVCVPVVGLCVGGTTGSGDDDGLLTGPRSRR